MAHQRKPTPYACSNRRWLVKTRFGDVQCAEHGPSFPAALVFIVRKGEPRIPFFLHRQTYLDVVWRSATSCFPFINPDLVQRNGSRPPSKIDDGGCANAPSALSFDHDVVMVDTPAERPEYSGDERPTKQMPREVQQKVRRRLAETANSSAPLPTELLPREGLRSIQAPPDSTTPDLNGTKEASAGGRSAAHHGRLDLDLVERQAVCRRKVGFKDPPDRPQKKPSKRVHKPVPSLEILVTELTGSGATKRIRGHALACARHTTALQEGWNEQRLLSLAQEWDKNSDFNKLVSCILRAYGVERMYVKARSKLQIDPGAPDPNLPTAIIDEFAPGVRENRTPDAFRRWLTLSRKLVHLCDYLPFIPFDSEGTVTFRDFERMANKDIENLLKHLDRNPRAQGLAKLGRAFRHRILRIESFVWENISVERLSELPSHTLLHLLTIRRDHRLDEPWTQGSPKANHLRSQCDMCEGGRCRLFLVAQDLAANHPTSVQALEQVSTLTSPPLPHLSTPRRIPDTAQAIAFAMHGNIEGLKGLFNAGQASVRDESYTRGFSLLRWALYGGHSRMHNYEIIRFLLDNGAYVDDECYNTVEYFRLRKMYSNADEHILTRVKHQDRNWCEEENFPLVHKIIFGISTKSLSQELLEHPDAAFSTDAHGRTALDWAAAREQLDDMRLLISYGSNPNSIDSTGRTTILHTVDSSNVMALRLLLEAGANAEPRIPEGQVRGNPLTSACLNSLPDMVELLVKFGADLNAPNPEGLNALHCAAVANNAECASILLDHGADINSTINGRTPLMTSIIHNSHSVLRLFLDKSYSGIDGSQLLLTIAEYADVETMSILKSHPSFDLIGSIVEGGRAKMSLRRDNNDRLSHAFEALICVCTGVCPPPPGYPYL